MKDFDAYWLKMYGIAQCMPFEELKLQFLSNPYLSPKLSKSDQKLDIKFTPENAKQWRHLRINNNQHRPIKVAQRTEIRDREFQLCGYFRPHDHLIPRMRRMCIANLLSKCSINTTFISYLTASSVSAPDDEWSISGAGAVRVK